MTHDLIIIGGSAAATAAGIYAARRNIKFKIITREFGGEVATSGEVNNYPGFSEGISSHIGKTNGIELAKAFKLHLQFYKVEMEDGVNVEGVKKSEDGNFEIKGEKNGAPVAYQSRAVIVATGAHPRKLGVEGEDAFYQKGVSYCTVCDGPLFPGRIVAVVGGGNSANEAGIMLSSIAKKVYVLTENPEMWGDEALVDKLKSAQNVTIIPNTETQKINGDKMVKSLEYKDKISGELKKLDVEGIFIHIGLIPNGDFLGAEVKKNKLGEIETDKFGRTSVPGMFAAGDVTDNPHRQIVIAAGQGALALLTAVNYLNFLK